MKSDMFDEIIFVVAMDLKKPEIPPLMEDFQDPKEYESKREVPQSKYKLMTKEEN